MVTLSSSSDMMAVFLCSCVWFVWSFVAVCLYLKLSRSRGDEVDEGDGRQAGAKASTGQVDWQPLQLHLHLSPNSSP